LTEEKKNTPNFKYKHADEDAWRKKNPGKEFKPFDPKRKIQWK